MVILPSFDFRHSINPLFNSKAALFDLIASVLSDINSVFLITISFSSLKSGFNSASIISLIFLSFVSMIIFIWLDLEFLTNFFISFKSKSDLIPAMQSPLGLNSESLVNSSVVLCVPRILGCPQAWNLYFISLGKDTTHIVREGIALLLRKVFLPF